MDDFRLPEKAYTAQQVAEMDRVTVEEVGVDLTQLMEVAGLRSAEAATELFPAGSTIAVLFGPGGNGGDALVAAKWLHLWGWKVILTPSHPPERYRDIVHHQRLIAAKLGIEGAQEPPENAGGIMDGLIGYSLKGNPTGRSAELIEWANTTGKPILALDIPSGLDATSGEARTPCIRADRTVVYGVMKKGLVYEGAKEYTGKVELVDIGFPRDFPDL